MKISSTGIELIKSFEGLRTVAYRCPSGVWTIGYGHTKDVKPRSTVSPQQAEKLLREDLEVFEDAVIKRVTVPLFQCQFDALVSLTFNIGEYAFRRSTLLVKLNRGDYIGAADQFMRWTRGGGRVLPGLVARRTAERNMFLGDD